MGFSPDVGGHSASVFVFVRAIVLKGMQRGVGLLAVQRRSEVKDKRYQGEGGRENQRRQIYLLKYLLKC
jgi:hypothetical protein